jgi:SulP family sulfate permease
MRAKLGAVPGVFVQPLDVLRAYRLDSLRPDVVAGLTIAVILMPQAVAYALIAELPPAMGLYTAIVAAIVGALWGSSRHLQTGPTNAISLVVVSSLLTVAAPGTPEYLVLAGLMAALVGALVLDRAGVAVIGEQPRGRDRLAGPSLRDWHPAPRPRPARPG